MKLTKNQTTDRILVDFYRATDRRRPITITYTKADGTETVRTVEPYDTRTTKAGDVIIKAMDRESGESRTFRLDRIHAYTIHRRMRLELDRPKPAVTLGPAVINTPDDLICREIARDDRDYWTDRYDHVA